MHLLPYTLTLPPPPTPHMRHPQVHVTYSSKGRLLEPCERIWAHAGHSGWSHT